MKGSTAAGAIDPAVLSSITFGYNFYVGTEIYEKKILDFHNIKENK